MNEIKLDHNELVSFCESSAAENNYDKFRMLLRSAVANLLHSTTQQKLMQQFYRLDLNEYDVLKALQLADINQKIDRITQLIFDRVLKKINTRMQSTKDN